MRALILGRGASLDRIDEVQLNNDYYCIVNDWSDILATTKAGEYIKTYGNGRIFHYVCRTESVLLTKEEYKYLNVNACVLNTHGTEYQNSRITSKLVKLNVIPLSLHPGAIKWSTNGRGAFPSTGILAVVDTVSRFKPTQVDIIGIDFFEDDYITKNSDTGSKTPRQEQKKKGRVMKSFLKDFMVSHPEVHFRIITNASSDGLFPQNIEVI